MRVDRLFPILILLSLAATSHAKTVKLEWAPEEGASKYELSIEDDGKPVFSKELDHPEWEGTLGFGFHAYRIRAIDEAGRAGPWSDPYSIIVMPPAPVLKNPVAKKKIDVFSGQGVFLEWGSMEGVNEYEVTLKRFNEVIYNAKAPKNGVHLGELPSGEYSWTVQGIISPGPSYPSLASRQWRTRSSDMFVFSLKRKNLDKPKLTYPIGEIWPSNDGKLTFKWEPVKEAAAYEIRLHEKLAVDKVQADAKPIEKVFRTESNSIEIYIGNGGRFVWSLKALGSAFSTETEMVNRRTTKGLVLEPWPESEAEFSLQRSESSKLSGFEGVVRSGYRLLSLDFTDVTRNVHGKTSTTGIPIEFGLRDALPNSWILTGLMESTFYNIDAKTNAVLHAEVAGYHQTDLSHGWSVDMGGGIELRQIPLLSPTSGGQSTDISNLSVIGGTVGAGVTKLLNPKWSGRLDGKVFHPFGLLSGEPGATLSPAPVLENLLVAASVMCSRGAKTTYSVSTGWESRRVNLNSPSGNSSDQTVMFNSLFLILGASYGF